MALPPAWKIRREAYRIKLQGKELLAPLWDKPRRVFYDQVAFRNLSLKTGDIPLSGKVAVYVVYQPNGLPDSATVTLDHLIANGWSPVVVVNSSMQATDYLAIKSRASRILKRPNVGYDFGAYRDGIIQLEKNGIAPEKLLLLNDSTWFPIFEDDTSLARMEALDADFAGHILKIEDLNNRARDHIESHCLMISNDMLRSEKFKKFWHGYDMSDSRDHTIERGEKGISQLAIHSDFKEAALLSREQLVEILSTLDDAALLDVARNVVHHLDSAHDQVEEIILSAEAYTVWRERFLAWVFYELSHSLQHLLSVTFIYPAMKYGGMGFLKKSIDARFQLARIKVLELSESGAIPPLHPVVKQEIEDAVASWRKPRDWRTRPEFRPPDAVETESTSRRTAPRKSDRIDPQGREARQAS